MEVKSLTLLKEMLPFIIQKELILKKPRNTWLRINHSLDMQEPKILKSQIQFHIWKGKLITFSQQLLKWVSTKEIVKNYNAKPFSKELMVQQPLLPKSTYMKRELLLFQTFLLMVVVLHAHTLSGLRILIMYLLERWQRNLMNRVKWNCWDWWDTQILTKMLKEQMK